jgi:hypothetical protein
VVRSAAPSARRRRRCLQDVGWHDDDDGGWVSTLSSDDDDDERALHSTPLGERWGRGAQDIGTLSLRVCGSLFQRKNVLTLDENVGQIHFIISKCEHPK